jgi:hypothetical protein
MITLVAARIGGARMRSADTATRGSAALWNERDPILKERLWRQRGHADTYVEWPKAEKEDHSVISSADASPTAAFPQARSFGLW